MEQTELLGVYRMRIHSSVAGHKGGHPFVDMLKGKVSIFHNKVHYHVKELPVRAVVRRVRTTVFYQQRRAWIDQVV
jgi:hypothetical protein